ncbi:MAG: hypothetical protein P8J33_12975 [Pirellulaceae bacterium]|nr:hypothetical protein [Pirellulaceae bacterium]
MEHPRDPLAGLASHYHSLNAQLKLAKALPNKGPNLEEAVLQQMDRLELLILDLVFDRR